MKVLSILILILSLFAFSVHAEQTDFSCESADVLVANEGAGMLDADSSIRNISDVSVETQSAADFALANCRFDSDCRFNERCEFGRCIDKNRCSSDYQCSYGNICDFGRCKPAECRGGPYDCPAGERCTNGRCERDPFAKRCTTSNDCKTYERCSLGYCQ